MNFNYAAVLVYASVYSSAKQHLAYSYYEDEKN